MVTLSRRIAKLESGANDYLKQATDEELQRIAGDGICGIKWADVLDSELDEMEQEIESGGTGEIAVHKAIARIKGRV